MVNPLSEGLQLVPQSEILLLYWFVHRNQKLGSIYCYLERGYSIIATPKYKT